MPTGRAGPWPYLLLAFAPLTWAGNVIVGRALADAVDPVTINIARWGGAALVLAAFAGYGLWTHRVELLRHWPIVVGLGLSGMGLFHLLQYTALQFTTALNVSLITAMTPLYVVLLAWAISGDRLDARGWFGVTLSIVGAVVIVAKGDIANLLALDVQLGDLIEIVAIFFWALYCVLLRYRPASIPPLPLLLASMLPGLAVSLAAYSLVPPRLDWSTEVGLALLYLATFPSAVAYIAWGAGTRVLGSQMAGLFSNLLPVYGAVLAVTVLGEPFRPYHLVSALLVACGILVASRAMPRPAAT
ncbi:MAG: DMT family transporter [Pseudomonadota bacterium]